MSTFRLINDVADNLRRLGYQVEMEPSMPSGYRPDMIILGVGGGKALVVECKVFDPAKASLTYDVIGLAARSGKEYAQMHGGEEAVPVVVGNFRVPDMVGKVATASGVQVVPVPTADSNVIAEAIARVLRN